MWSCSFDSIRKDFASFICGGLRHLNSSFVYPYPLNRIHWDIRRSGPYSGLLSELRPACHPRLRRCQSRSTIPTHAVERGFWLIHTHTNGGLRHRWMRCLVIAWLSCSVSSVDRVQSLVKFEQLFNDPNQTKLLIMLSFIFCYFTHPLTHSENQNYFHYRCKVIS